jgi:hypothetical protein
MQDGGREEEEQDHAKSINMAPTRDQCFRPEVDVACCAGAKHSMITSPPGRSAAAHLRWRFLLARGGRLHAIETTASHPLPDVGARGGVDSDADVGADGELGGGCAVARESVRPCSAGASASAAGSNTARSALIAAILSETPRCLASSCIFASLPPSRHVRPHHVTPNQVPLSARTRHLHLVAK